MYVLQPKADHPGSIISSTEFLWIGPFIIEKLLPNNNYLVRKIGTNKTEVLQRMRMCQITPRQPLPYIRIMPQEAKPEAKMSLKHDDLYDRALECDYEMLFFDAKNDNAKPPNSSEFAVHVDLPTEESWNTRETARERSRKLSPQMVEFCDLTGPYSYMEHDAKTDSEQPNIRPTNPRISNYLLRHKRKPKCNDDYRS